MLTAAELPAVEGALNELRDAIAAADAVYGARPWWLGVSPAANTADVLYIALGEADQLVRELNADRDRLVEAPGFDHEAALAIVDRARTMAGRLAVASGTVDTVTVHPGDTMAGTAADQLGQLGDAAAAVGSATAGVLAWVARYALPLGALVLLVLFAPTINAAARALPRRRDA